MDGRSLGTFGLLTVLLLPLLLPACDSDGWGACTFSDGDYLYCTDGASSVAGDLPDCDTGWYDGQTCAELGYPVDCGEGVQATEESLCDGAPGDDDDSGR